MKCPKCSTEISQDSNKCSFCHYTLDKDEEFDRMIFKLVEEEDLHLKNDSSNKKRADIKKTMVQTLKREDLAVSRKDTKKTIIRPRETINQGKILVDEGLSVQNNYKKQYGILSYVVMVSALLFVLLTFLNWYKISGQVSYIGYVHNEDNQIFLNKKIKTINKDQLNVYDGQVAAFSPFDLLLYINASGDAYYRLDDEESLSAKVQGLYIRSYVVIVFLVFISVLLSIFDSKREHIDFVKNSAIASLFFIILNYISMKIPIFSMFIWRARTIFNRENIATSYTKGGILAGSKYYHYSVSGSIFFYLALLAVLVWLLASIMMSEVALIDAKNRKAKKED